MRLAGTGWQITVSRVRLGSNEYRVVRPAWPIRGSLEDRSHCLDLSVHHDDAAVIAHAWTLALRSPHSLVYLPLRGTFASLEVPLEQQLDLVLSHHQLALRTAEWKQIRSRLGSGQPQTISYREPHGEPDYERIYHRENRDHLHWSIQANTVFLTGSRPAFAVDVPRLRDFAQDAPGQTHTSPDWHHCAEVTLGAPYVKGGRNFGELHIVAV